MFSKLRNLLKKANEPDTIETRFDISDTQLAQVALMFRVIAADGVICDKERNWLHHILETRYDLSNNEANQLIEEAEHANNEAVDLYAFTSVLKYRLSKSERIKLIENLWEMVFSDGIMHELEDNVVWRIAELLAVDRHNRVQMKQKVRQKHDLKR